MSDPERTQELNMGEVGATANDAGPAEAGSFAETDSPADIAATPPAGVVPHVGGVPDTDEEPLAKTQELPLGLAGYESVYYEAEPTTASIPIAGGTAGVLVEEPEPTRGVSVGPDISPRRARLGLLALAVGYFAIAANEASVVALSTTIAGGLGEPVSSIGLLATAFALTVVIATLPLTMLTKRWRKPVTLSTAFTLWTAGAVVIAVSNGLAMFAVGRVMSAMAHALILAVIAPAAASLFAPHLRARTVTTVMLGSAAAGVLGTPLVTAVGASVSWRVPYWGFAVLGMLLAVTLAIVIPATKVGRHQKHTVGDLPSRPAYFRVLAVAFLTAAGMALSWTYVVPMFTEIGGLPMSAIPLLFGLGGALAVGATLGISGHLSRRPVHTVGIAIAGLALAWGLLALGQEWSVVAFQAIQAAAWAVLVAGLLNWALRHSPWRTEIGAGAYAVVFNSGAAAGPVVGGALVAAWGLWLLPYVSLALTILAGVVVATVDSRTIQRLRVPRQVRAALAAQVALSARRSEWWWRKRLSSIKPQAYSDLTETLPRVQLPKPPVPKARGSKKRIRGKKKK